MQQLAGRTVREIHGSGLVVSQFHCNRSWQGGPRYNYRDKPRRPVSIQRLVFIGEDSSVPGHILQRLIYKQVQFIDDLLTILTSRRFYLNKDLYEREFIFGSIMEFDDELFRVFTEETAPQSHSYSNEILRYKVEKKFILFVLYSTRRDCKIVGEELVGRNLSSSLERTNGRKKFLNYLTLQTLWFWTRGCLFYVLGYQHLIRYSCGVSAKESNNFVENANIRAEYFSFSVRSN